ncbi:MAG: AAA family ATPase [Candidatus Brocadiaceae bacterium]|nr:AAA family ATPase [Candidatus Brocadiaceae bacterium]
MPTLIHQEKLSGVVERVTFHSRETGWTVLKVSPFKTPASIKTVLVHQATVFAGASMEFHGNWITHQKYGEQFKAEKAIEKKPASAAALEKYLGSGLIKGVGPKTAHKIVTYFGDKTLEIFEEKIEELVNVPSIAEKKLSQIRSSWEEHKAIRDVMMFLQSHGVSTLFSVKIFKAYGNDAIAIVSENPYRLARDIHGIGFFSADRIALNMEFRKDGKERIQAGIKHILNQSRDNGHCYLTREQILDNTQELLQLENTEFILQLLDKLYEEGEVKRRFLKEEEETSIECFYSKSLYGDEEYVYRKVQSLIKNLRPVDIDRVQRWIDTYCAKYTIALSDEQHASIIAIVQKSFSILTGGPGCGKTTTTRVLVKLLEAMKKKILLTAPTGRAAQRMTEVIGIESKTVHRLLEWEPQKGGFKKGEEHPLHADFLIVDECSMLDITLAASLLKAVPDTCQVLFIGDPDQLPSVGAGAVLRDLLSSGVVPHSKLTRIFRQAEQSDIITFAHQINKGITPKIFSPLAAPDLWEKSTDCLFIDSDEATQDQLKFIMRSKHIISKTIKEKKSHYIQIEDTVVGQLREADGSIQVDELCIPARENSENTTIPVFSVPKKFKYVNLETLSSTSDGIEELMTVLKTIHPWSSLHYGYTAIDTIRRLYTKTIKDKLGNTCEVQILTPQVRGSLGAVNLNTMIQEAVNPASEGKGQFKIGERVLREGDRIIQTRNNYDLSVFNGDIGRIVSIDPEDYCCKVQFGDQSRIVTYQKEDLTELSLAYAITIHKSQGSEFDAVILPVTTQHFKMLFRNLIYTGLTRAKKLAVFVGSRKALVLAVKSIDNRKRQTALEQLLKHNK